MDTCTTHHGMALDRRKAAICVVGCTVYTVHCTLYTIQCTLYTVHCTVYTVRCTLYTVNCTPASQLFQSQLPLHCTMYWMHIINYFTVHCTVLYPALYCTLHDAVPCTMHKTILVRHWMHLLKLSVALITLSWLRWTIKGYDSTVLRSQLLAKGTSFDTFY